MAEGLGFPHLRALASPFMVTLNNSHGFAVKALDQPWQL